MPHSPELSLKMSSEMDGIRRVRTKGGSDLVDYRYYKPAMWGDVGAWELYGTPPTSDDDLRIAKLSRSGRRTWDLSFNHLQGSDVFGSNQSLSNLDSNGTYYPIYTKSGYGSDFDADYYNRFKYNILTDDNFFSQVLHKTQGNLPFIFQPDRNNNNPDGFAICKFDQSSFEFSQASNTIYNFKCKIKEVW
jgi:hypothetical protein